MKITVIGDVHGRKDWKRALAAENDSDLFVFLGDYLDSRDPDVTFMSQLDNLKEIISLKKENPGRFVLLLGNHDLAYAGRCRNGISGRDRPEEFFDIFRKNLGLFSVMHMYGNVLFSHAGLSESWMRISVPGMSLKDLAGPLTEERIRAFSEPARFSGGGRLSRLDWNSYTGYDIYGDSAGNGPAWIRPRALLSDWYRFGKRTVQVVGHTPGDHVRKISAVSGDCSLDLWLCDSPDSEEYLVIENSGFHVRRPDPPIT